MPDVPSWKESVVALSRKLMIDGEEVVLSMRTHVKRLIVPVLVLLATCALAGFLLAISRDTDAAEILTVVIVAVAAVVLVWWVVLPFLRWLTTTYTVTNRRLIEQTGLLTRTGRVIPLNRINDVAFERNLNDRVLGSGTLIIHDASEQAGMRVLDVPRVQEVHRTLTNLVFDMNSPGGKDRGPQVDDEQI